MAKTHHVKSSALDQIDATIQPMGPQPALRAEVDQLVKLNDIRALVALYDAFAAAAVTFQAIQNRPAADEVEILEEESADAWSKAFYVADRLKKLRPDVIDLEQYAALHSEAYGEAVDVASLIPHIVSAFVARDRDFQRIRKTRRS